MVQLSLSQILYKVLFNLWVATEVEDYSPQVDFIIYNELLSSSPIHGIFPNDHDFRSLKVMCFKWLSIEAELPTFRWAIWTE